MEGREREKQIIDPWRERALLMVAAEDNSTGEEWRWRPTASRPAPRATSSLPRPVSEDWPAGAARAPCGHLSFASPSSLSSVDFETRF